MCWDSQLAVPRFPTYYQALNIDGSPPEDLARRTTKLTKIYEGSLKRSIYPFPQWRKAFPKCSKAQKVQTAAKRPHNC
jgi:hypothetical protein